MGDIVIVINDSTSSNNGSYIYNGSGWSTLALYNTIGMLSNLSDVTLSSLAVIQILKWNGTKWVNTAVDDRLAIYQMLHYQVYQIIKYYNIIHLY